MEQIKNASEKYHYGYATFENFWGKDIKNVTLTHSADVPWGSMKDWQHIEHVPNKGILENCFGFKYYIGVGSDIWHIKFWTYDREVYECKHDFSCNITSGDGGRVILGINGESRKLYAHFSSSSDCSTGISSA